MKIKFDSKQQFQIDAVNAVVDVFDGQPLNKGDFEIAFETDDMGSWGTIFQTELGVGNNFLINDDAILKNVQKIQDRNDIEKATNLQG